MRLDYYLPKKFQGYLSTGFVLFLFAVLLSSCLKNNDDDYVPELSNLMVVNAYPAGDINFWYAGSRVTSPALEYSANTPYYENLYASYEIAFTKNDANYTILARSGAPGGSKDYSVFVTGTGDSTFLTRDDLITPDASKVAIRFVNASKSAGAVDVTINDASAFSDIAFQKNSDFKQFDSSTGIEVKVFAKGTTTNPMVTTTLNGLVAGKSYTIYTRGIKESQDPLKELGVDYVDHNKAKE